MTATILFTQQSGVGHLRFNRPDRRNALGQEELEAISAALDALDKQTRVLMVSATEGRHSARGLTCSKSGRVNWTGISFKVSPIGWLISPSRPFASSTVTSTAVVVSWHCPAISGWQRRAFTCGCRPRPLDCVIR